MINLKAQWNIDTEQNLSALDAKYGNKVILVNYRNFNGIYSFCTLLHKAVGVIEKNNLVTIYKRGKKLKRQITKDKFIKKYFTEML